VREEDREVEDLPEFLARLVAKGLRAQLATGSLITGQMFIELDFHPDDAPREIAMVNGVPELPTVPSTVQHATAMALDLLAQLRALPLAEVGAKTRDAVTAIESVATKLDGKIDSLATDVNEAVKIAGQAMEEARVTLTTMRGAVAENSPLHYELSNLLSELAEASRSIRVLASYLERHPEAVLRGKPEGSGE
jgi:paraquat-inducible protein B